MLETILDILGVIVSLGIIIAIVVIWNLISDKLDVKADNFKFPEYTRYNVLVRNNTGGWVPRASNIESEQQAWNYAEQFKAEDGRPVKIEDNHGKLIGTL